MLKLAADVLSVEDLSGIESLVASITSILIILLDGCWFFSFLLKLY